MAKKPIIVGYHPEYIRRQDVEIQTWLARPEVKIVQSLEQLAAQIIEYSTAEFFLEPEQMELIL